MKMRKITSHEYGGAFISFDVEGWMNASHAGVLFEKDPGEWLGLDLTQLYVTELAKRRGVTIDSMMVTRRGNERLRGLWLHPKLAGKFARWLSIDFEIWFDDQMEVTSKDVVAVEAARRQAAMGFRSLCEALAITHQAIGKETKPHHYMNEARLINEILTGVFQGRDRSQLTIPELELVTLMENRDVLLLGQGKSYSDRKAALTQYLGQLSDSRSHLYRHFG